MTENDEIVIRTIDTLDEMYAAADLQRIYWGNEVESLVPAHMLYTIVSYGGHVIGAFNGDRMIGLVIGMLGTNIEESHRPAMANLLIASKRMVVLPEYRSGGIGQRLKLKQRELAIRQGIRMITWTFDPLRAPNAHLNLRKLGGIGQAYQENLYGTRDGNGLALFGVSDRLKLEWWVTNRRVEERLNGSRPDLTLPQYFEANATLVNPAQPGDPFVTPAGQIREPQGRLALVEIPLNFAQMIEADPDLAHQWQLHIREVMTKLFQLGFIATDFLRSEHEGRDRGIYVMSYDYGF
jgi:predicted GNAT superfamily acetyltransferase